MGLYNLEYLESAFERANNLVLNKGKNNQGFFVRRSYTLTKGYQERIKQVFPNSKEIIPTEDQKERKKLYILDLMGTLYEGVLVARPFCKEMGEEIKKYYYYTESYQTRLAQVSKNINSLLENGNDVAIVSSHDHTEEYWMNTILNEIEESLDSKNKGKVKYYVCGLGKNMDSNKSDKNVATHKENKKEAFKDLLREHPNSDIVVVDDQPDHNPGLQEILAIPGIKEKLTIIAIWDNSHYNMFSTVEGLRRYDRIRGRKEKTAEEYEKEVAENLKLLNKVPTRTIDEDLNNLQGKVKDRFNTLITSNPEFIKYYYGLYYRYRRLLYGIECDMEINEEEKKRIVKNVNSIMSAGRYIISDFSNWWNIVLPPEKGAQLILHTKK